MNLPPPDPNSVLLRHEDGLASLRTWLMIVGVLAVAALGVAAYALLTADDGSSTTAGLATQASVSQLSERVDDLATQQKASGSAAGAGATLGNRVAALERTVKALAARPTPGDATQAVKELSSRIDDVTKDVEQLKQAAATP
jgi:hypothetical protein